MHRRPLVHIACMEGSWIDSIARHRGAALSALRLHFGRSLGTPCRSKGQSLDLMAGVASSRISNSESRGPETTSREVLSSLRQKYEQTAEMIPQRYQGTSIIRVDVLRV